MSNTFFQPSAVAEDLRNPTLMSFVDMARWMAAAMVMVGHLRNPMFIGYGELPPSAQTLWVKGWYFLTGFHAEAVLIFFVLSGFLVGGLSGARASNGNFAPDNYAIDRFSRLFIAFLPALFLTLVLDVIGSHYFGSTGLYNGTHPMIVQKVQGISFENNLSWPVFLGNMAMLQMFFVPMLGSNQPLWSLSFEFWFYAVFGLALCAILMRKNTRWLTAAAALCIVAILGTDFALYFGQWLLGLFAALIRPKRTGHPVAAALGLAAWLLVIRIFDAPLDNNLSLKMAAHYGMALLFAWLIIALRGRQIGFFRHTAGLNKFMADFSYSLYLIHFPVMIFTLAVLGKMTGNPGFAQAFLPTDPVGVTTYIAMVLFLLFIAWCFAQLTERHTALLRNWLKARQAGHRRGAVAS